MELRRALGRPEPPLKPQSPPQIPIPNALLVFCLDLDDLFSSFFPTPNPDVLEPRSSMALVSCVQRQTSDRLFVIFRPNDNSVDIPVSRDAT